MATWLKNSINRASAWFKVDELYWPKKEEFRLKVLENIQKDFEEKWVNVNNIYFVWDMILPEQVKEIIEESKAKTFPNVNMETGVYSLTGT